MRAFLIAAFLLSWSLPASRADDGPTKYHYLGVGVEKYTDARMQPLKYAADDVTELGKLLAEHGYESTLLVEPSGPADAAQQTAAELRPTKQNILNSLRAVGDRCTKKDVLIVALSGQGLQFAGDSDAYFCPIDARPFADETNTLLSISSVYQQLDKSFASLKLLIIDACRNDPDPARGVEGTSLGTVPSGIAVLYSCSAGQRAYEFDELKHGALFHCVIEGLRGKAVDAENHATLFELLAHVQRCVPATVGRLQAGRKQEPQFVANISGAPPTLLQKQLPSSAR